MMIIPVLDSLTLQVFQYKYPFSLHASPNGESFGKRGFSSRSLSYRSSRFLLAINRMSLCWPMNPATPDRPEDAADLFGLE